MRLGQTSIVSFISRLGSSLLGFLATLYFAKVLGSDFLGVYFLSLALVAWLKIGSSIGIPLAVTKRVSEATDRESHVLAASLLGFVGTLVVASAVFLFREPVNRYLGGDYYLFIILLLCAQVAYSLMGSVLKGLHLVHVEEVLGVSQTVIRVAVQVSAVYLGYQVTGLLFGEFAAFGAVVVAGVVILVSWVGVSIPTSLPESSHFWSIFDFAKYSVLGSLKGRSFNMMDTVVLGLFVPSGLIGVYGICWNISAVLDIFAKSLGTSLFPEMSKLSSEDEDKEVADNLTKALAFAGLFIIPGFVGALVVGRGVLNLYGPEFKKGYVVLVILVLAILFNSYHKQLTNTLDAVNRPDLSFRVNVFFVVTNVVLNVLLVYLYGWIGAAVATAVSVFASLVLAYRLTAGLYEFTIPVSEIANQVVSAIVMGIFVYAFLVGVGALGFDPQRVSPVLGAVTIGTGTYFACLFLVSSSFRLAVSENLPLDVPF